MFNLSSTVWWQWRFHEWKQKMFARLSRTFHKIRLSWILLLLFDWIIIWLMFWINFYKLPIVINKIKEMLKIICFCCILILFWSFYDFFTKLGRICISFADLKIILFLTFTLIIFYYLFFKNSTLISAIKEILNRNSVILRYLSNFVCKYLKKKEEIVSNWSFDFPGTESLFCFNYKHYFYFAPVFCFI